MNYQRELRLQRAAERLCSLHPRVVFELLNEIGRTHGIANDVLARAEMFAGLDPDLLAALGADRFPRSIQRVG